MPTAAGPNSNEQGLVFAIDMGDTKNSNLGLPVHNVIRPLNEWRLKRISIDQELTPGAYNSPLPKSRIWKCSYSIDSVYSNTLTRDSGEGYYPGANSLILPDTVWRGESLYYYSMWVRGFNTNASDSSLNMDLNDRNGDGATLSDEVWRKLEVYNTSSHTNQNYDFHDLVVNRGSKDRVDFLVTGLMLCRTEGNSYAELGQITTPPSWLPEGAIRTSALKDLTGNKTDPILNVSHEVDGAISFDGTDDYVDTGITSDNWAEETFTLEAVVRYDALSNHSWFEMSRPGIVNASGFISVVRNDNFYFYWIGPYGGDGHSVESPLINPNEYIYIAITFNGVGGTDQDVLYDNTTTYLNGVETPHVPKGSAGISSGGNLYYGSAQYKMRGDVPVYKYYNRELSAEEIANNYNILKKRFNI